MSLITRKEYLKAVSDLSEVHNIDFDKMLADYDPITRAQEFIGRHFQQRMFEAEGRQVIALVDQLVLQGYVKSKYNKRGSSIVVDFDEVNTRKLRKMYRDHKLQEMWGRVEQDQLLIDKYAKQPREQETKRRLQLPMVRVRDQINGLKDQLTQQNKRYERIAAIQSLKAQKEKYRQMSNNMRKGKQQNAKVEVRHE